LIGHCKVRNAGFFQTRRELLQDSGEIIPRWSSTAQSFNIDVV
jgi:hypothetical protein